MTTSRMCVRGASSVVFHLSLSRAAAHREFESVASNHEHVAQIVISEGARGGPSGLGGSSQDAHTCKCVACTSTHMYVSMTAVCV